MNWTTERPTQPGWYWHRKGANGAPEISQVIAATKGCAAFYDCSEGELVFVTDEGAFRIADTLQFAGPIPEPSEPKPLESLGEYHRRQREQREAYEQAAKRSGIACPKCGAEMDADTSSVLCSMPPQQRLVCPKCGHVACRVV